MVIETLFDNEWLSLREVREPDRGINGYVYSHEKRCNGLIVAVLPYRWSDEPHKMEFLVKEEVTPCWGLDPERSAITGGYEGVDVHDDAVRELAEETGYSVPLYELISLGTCYASKSSDTVYHLFTVDLTGREPGEAVGDGSRLEAESSAVWIDSWQLAGILDPQVHVMHNRIRMRQPR
jgi:ADP-ribose pyrophosphatase YjhB (NUDIX family)